VTRFAAAAPRSTAPVGEGTSPPSTLLLVTLLAAELGLLAFGILTGHLLAGVALAALGAYFLVAFRAPDVAWALVWIAVPFSIEVRLVGGSAISLPTEPMIAAALAAWGLRALLAGEFRLPRSSMNAPLAALAGIALISVACSAYPLVGIKAWIVAAAYAAFGYLYLLTRPCSPARRERWMRIVILSGALWGLYGSVRVFMLGVNPRLAYGIARPFFVEHGTFSAYLAMILPLALLLAIDRRGWARAAYALGALFIALGITLSFTRAAWVSLLIVLPVMAFIWARGRVTWRGVGIPVVLAMAIFAVIVAADAGRYLSRHAESVVDVANISNLERVNRWMAAWEMTKDRPWTGVGYGAYAPAYSQYRRKVIVTEVAYQFMGPHSEPLRLLSETGVFGLCASLWFLWAAARTGLRVFRASPDPNLRLLSLGVLSGLATYALHGVFNSYLGYDKVTVPFWFGLGVLGALGSGQNANREAEGRRQP